MPPLKSVTVDVVVAGVDDDEEEEEVAVAAVAVVAVVVVVVPAVVAFVAVTDVPVNVVAVAVVTAVRVLFDDAELVDMVVVELVVQASHIAGQVNLIDGPNTRFVQSEGANRRHSSASKDSPHAPSVRVVVEDVEVAGAVVALADVDVAVVSIGSGVVGVGPVTAVVATAG